MELDKIMTPEEQSAAGVSKLTESEKQALGTWALRVFGLGQHTTGEIEKIKYAGRLIVLDDGSRFEVDDLDADTADGWLAGDRVVVIEDEMFRLDELEKVSVERE
ncbi:MAG: hypothetical protein H6807_11320 [Planctomycetes bacterium]|nr:hypothetical protein [Planctomycetota bacterium]